MKQELFLYLSKAFPTYFDKFPFRLIHFLPTLLRRKPNQNELISTS